MSNYGIAIADDRGGMLEITSLPFSVHAEVTIKRMVPRSEPYVYKLAPAPAGRNLYMIGHEGFIHDFYLVPMIGAASVIAGIAKHKYTFDQIHSTPNGAYISKYEIHADGTLKVWITASRSRMEGDSVIFTIWSGNQGDI